MKAPREGSVQMFTQRRHSLIFIVTATDIKASKHRPLVPIVPQLLFCHQICYYYLDNQTWLVINSSGFSVEMEAFSLTLKASHRKKNVIYQMTALTCGVPPFSLLVWHHTSKISPTTAVKVSRICKYSRRRNQSNASRLKATIKQPAAVWK